MEWGLAFSAHLGYLLLCMACQAQTARQDCGKSSHPLQATSLAHRKGQLETVMSDSRLFLNSSWKIMAAAFI